MPSFPDGIILADKPRDVTSFAVVNRVRKTLMRTFEARRLRGAPRFRVGHAGTLDPLATGLLIVLVGRASRLSPFLLGLDKTYTATVRFGTETDTLDAEGDVTVEAAPPAGPQEVAAVLPRFTGEITQVPPIYSALKRDGRSLHRLARSGQEVAEPEPRTVIVTRLEQTGHRWLDDLHEVELEIGCGSGTYVRSLARDIGRAVGSAAHLRALRRTRIGPFDCADAVDVMVLGAQDLLAQLVPMEAALPHLPRLSLTMEQTLAVLDGAQPRPEWLADLQEAVAVGERFTLLDPGGRLVAVGELDAVTGMPRLVAVVGRKDDLCA